MRHDLASPAIQPRSWSPAADGGLGPGGTNAAGSAARDAAAIHDHLAQEVVGQRRALRELSLLLAMHMAQPVGASIPNGIVLGPSGCGKTHTLSIAAASLGVPFVSVDATSLVPSGIVGEQVEDLLESLVHAADALLSAGGRRRRRDDDVDLAQRGIVLIDELDKLAAPDGVTSSSSQTEKRVVQRRLLKLVEGARLRVGTKRHVDDRRERFIDTAGILLLASGAFTGLPFARRRVASSDIVGLGFLPELVARLPVLISFDPLAAADLVAILEHERVSPLAAWRSYFDIALHARLELDDAAMWIIAERAAGLGMGARGLDQVLFPVLAARAGETIHSGTRGAVTLRAADFMPEIAAVPVTAPLQ